MANTNELPALVELLEKQKEMKLDRVIKGANIEYRDGKIWVRNPLIPVEYFNYTPTDLFHTQMAEKLGIPAKYYDRCMADAPEILEANINLWFAKDANIKYLLRTFHNDGSGVARALLSNSFNILDNYDVLFTALKAIKDMGVNVKITKAQVSDKRLYLHVTCPEIEIQADAFLREYLKHNDAAGNGIISGLVIANSEVGLGTFEIRPRAVICKCNNGLVVKDESFKKVHLGTRMDEGEIEWSARTKQKNYELIMSQTQDAVKKFLSPEYLGRMVEKISAAHSISLQYPIDTIQHVCHELDITDKYKQDIIKYFVEDGDSKASGVFNAITRSAQDMPLDAQYDVEANAFSILSKIQKFDKPFSRN